MDWGILLQSFFGAAGAIAATAGVLHAVGTQRRKREDDSRERDHESIQALIKSQEEKFTQLLKFHRSTHDLISDGLKKDIDQSLNMQKDLKNEWLEQKSYINSKFDSMIHENQKNREIIFDLRMSIHKLENNYRIDKDRHLSILTDRINDLLNLTKDSVNNQSEFRRIQRDLIDMYHVNGENSAQSYYQDKK